MLTNWTENNNFLNVFSKLQSIFILFFIFVVAENNICCFVTGMSITTKKIIRIKVKKLIIIEYIQGRGK
jgi:hypothetical protein